jgi:hypothetical protein
MWDRAAGGYDHPFFLFDFVVGVWQTAIVSARRRSASCSAA